MLDLSLIKDTKFGDFDVEVSSIGYDLSYKGKKVCGIINALDCMITTVYGDISDEALLKLIELGLRPYEYRIINCRHPNPNLFPLQFGTTPRAFKNGNYETVTHIPGIYVTIDSPCTGYTHYNGYKLVELVVNPGESLPKVDRLIYRYANGKTYYLKDVEGIREITSDNVLEIRIGFFRDLLRF